MRTAGSPKAMTSSADPGPLRELQGLLELLDRGLGLAEAPQHRPAGEPSQQREAVGGLRRPCRRRVGQDDVGELLDGGEVAGHQQPEVAAVDRREHVGPGLQPQRELEGAPERGAGLGRAESEPGHRDGAAARLQRQLEPVAPGARGKPLEQARGPGP